MTRVNSNFRSRLRQGFLGKASNVTKHSGRTSGISFSLRRPRKLGPVLVQNSFLTRQTAKNLQILADLEDRNEFCKSGRPSLRVPVRVQNEFRSTNWLKIKVFYFSCMNHFLLEALFFWNSLYNSDQSILNGKSSEDDCEECVAWWDKWWVEDFLSICRNVADFRRICEDWDWLPGTNPQFLSLVCRFFSVLVNVQ